MLVFRCTIYLYVPKTGEFAFLVPPNDLQIDDTGLPLGSVIDRDFDKRATLKNSISAGLQSSGNMALSCYNRYMYSKWGLT